MTVAWPSHSQEKKSCELEAKGGPLQPLGLICALNIFVLAMLCSHGVGLSLYLGHQHCHLS